MSLRATRQPTRATQALDVAALLRRAWPGERVLPRAGANRVYVALATLRKLGLRHTIRRDADGYSFHPATAVEDLRAQAG